MFSQPFLGQRGNPGNGKKNAKNVKKAIDKMKVL